MEGLKGSSLTDCLSKSSGSSYVTLLPLSRAWISQNPAFQVSEASLLTSAPRAGALSASEGSDSIFAMTTTAHPTSDRLEDRGMLGSSQATNSSTHADFSPAASTALRSARDSSKASSTPLLDEDGRLSSAGKQLHKLMSPVHRADRNHQELLHL